MKVVLCIVVFNRFNNLQRWLNCWQQCEQRAQMVVIHTGTEIEKFKKECEQNSVLYIHRENIGFDIGCMQDVFKGRLQGFPEWDLLLWCTDDTIPVSKDFIKPFIDAMQPGVGIAAMQISRSVADHVRTTGFMISRNIASRIKFPADPITTRSQCYHLEHRGAAATMTMQIRNMGLSCVQVAPNNVSPMWDTGYWKRLNRQAEHDALFDTGKKKGDKVTVICTIYNSYPAIISSLIMQTHKNWELILIHDGPSSNGMKSYIPNDPRITYIETEERQGNYGHPLRQWALQQLNEGNLSDPDYILITNSDNYYVPVAIEYLLKGFNKSHTIVASYCSDTIHSYKAWQILPAKLERGFLDCGAVIIKKDIACEVGWNSFDHSADWSFFSEIAGKYSWRNFVSVKGVLFVHN